MKLTFKLYTGVIWASIFSIVFCPFYPGKHVITLCLKVVDRIPFL